MFNTLRKKGTSFSFRLLLSLALLLTVSAVSFAQDADEAPAKPRTIITTDGEVDDIDSFIRYLYYANEFDLEGLVYTSSQWHYEGDGLGTLFTSELESTAERYGERTELRWVGTDWIDEYIDLYEEIYPNLVLHAEGYPTPDELRSLIRIGNISFEGEMELVTDGSELIKEVLLDDEPGPVYLQVWGGTNVIARALLSIEEEYSDTPEWEEIYARVSEKAVIYAILDQDATYRNYVEPNWPDIRVLYNSAQFWSFAYAWPFAVPAELQVYLNGEWFAENVLFNHGALAGSYFTWGDGKRLHGDYEYTRWNLEGAIASGRMQYDFISEGDSPSYLHLLDVGLRNLEDGSFGGWGGRMVQSETSPNRWEDGDHVTDFNPYTGEADTFYPQVRWIDAIQNDFAARVDWGVSTYEEANHAPEVSLGHANDLTAAAGETVSLVGSATDPDGDAVSFTWWQYGDVDSYAGEVEISGADSAEASFVVPADAVAGDTIHIILQVADDGSPSITRYQRVIVTVGE